MTALGGPMADVWYTAAGKPPMTRLGQEGWVTRQQLLRIHTYTGLRVSAVRWRKGKERAGCEEAEGRRGRREAD